MDKQAAPQILTCERHDQERTSSAPSGNQRPRQPGATAARTSEGTVPITLGSPPSAPTRRRSKAVLRTGKLRAAIPSSHHPEQLRLPISVRGSTRYRAASAATQGLLQSQMARAQLPRRIDRKSTRLNSSHL